MNPLHPKKLLLSKWTAVKPVGKDKHFVVVKVIEPDPPDAAVAWVELEALFSRRVQRLAWRALRDPAVWRQGWV
ncbi:MAG: TIGR02450 family Trp-rich protein [Burkholderiales bacterium]|nr:TIGR02450 family Trp-rich protein [Burkholderiales bacterium]